MRTKNKICLKERIALLSKPNWSWYDIAQYFNYGRSKATEIRQKARIEGGGHPIFDSSLTTVESVMVLAGTTVYEELEKLEKIYHISGSERNG